MRLQSPRESTRVWLAWCLLSELGDELACLLGVPGGAGADGLEVTEGGLGVEKGVPV